MQNRNVPIVFFTCMLLSWRASADNVHYIAFATRSIDVSAQLVRVREIFTFRNNGTTVSNHFVYTSQENETNLVHFKALEAGRPLKFTRRRIQQEDILTYSVYLNGFLDPGQKSTIEIYTILRNQLMEVPFAMEKGDQFAQKHIYISNRFIYSPYHVRFQTTKISAGKQESEISFMHKAPLSVAPLTLVMMSDIKFFVVTKLSRQIKVSHWGKIDVEDTVNLRNKGPVPRDPWGVQYKNWSGFRQLITFLPASAHDIYYRDAVGNISESIVSIKKRLVELVLFFRFPLLGGWKTQYMMGYKIPCYAYLNYSKVDSSYVLNMKLFDYIYKDMIIEEATTTVILPEGSKNLEVSIPSSIHHKIRNDTIEVSGRTALIEMFNLVEDDMVNFQLKYSFNTLWILQEPIIYSAMIYFIFLVSILALHCDFSILKDDPKGYVKLHKSDKLD